MAAGYVIALILEAAGLIGLLTAACLMRSDRRARAAELRSFLRSGQSALAEAPPAARRRGGRPSRAVDLPVVLGGAGAATARDSVARTALRRALARGGPAAEIGSIGSM